MRVTVSLTLLLQLVLQPTSFAMSTSASSQSSRTVKPSYAKTTLPIPASSSALNMSGDDSNEEEEGEEEDDGMGYLETLKTREASLARMLQSVRREKLSVLRSKPLTIGVIGFGRFGQFIARTFAKHGRVVVTSRSDYTSIAEGMGVTYVPMSDMGSFVGEGLDVIVVAVSILSFEGTIQNLAKYIEKDVKSSPLVVDVLSVKEHPRNVMLDMLPSKCDILCSHPMFGPDSGKHGWHNLNFVYERTRIDGVVIDPNDHKSFHQLSETEEMEEDDVSSFLDIRGNIHDLHENSLSHVGGMDRMERFLSIWEEEGCRMVQMSCQEHDEHAANSQFITHLMGRILDAQGLRPTPIDTKGFESVLKLIGTTSADSFDLFYGLYKYNKNSFNTIATLKSAIDDVVKTLAKMEDDEKKKHEADAEKKVVLDEKTKINATCEEMPV